MISAVNKIYNGVPNNIPLCQSKIVEISFKAAFSFNVQSKIKHGSILGNVYKAGNNAIFLAGKNKYLRIFLSVNTCDKLYAVTFFHFGRAVALVFHCKAEQIHSALVNGDGVCNRCAALAGYFKIVFIAVSVKIG